MNNFVVGKNVSVDLDTDDCIQWPLRIMGNGYGVKSDRSYPQRIVTAHRWVWEKVVGPLPAGSHLDHLCHSADSNCPGGYTCSHRACINPRHLEPVTPAVNNERARAIKTPKTVCNHGHDLTVEGAVVMLKTATGAKRTCRLCRNAWARSWRTANLGKVASYTRATRERIGSDESNSLDPDGMPRGASQDQA